MARMFRVLELAIRDVLIEAAACGELAPRKDPAIQATLLVNNIYGLRVYSKLQPKGSAIADWSKTSPACCPCSHLAQSRAGSRTIALLGLADRKLGYIFDMPCGTGMFFGTEVRWNA